MWHRPKIPAVKRLRQELEAPQGNRGHLLKTKGGDCQTHTGQGPHGCTQWLGIQLSCNSACHCLASTRSRVQSPGSRKSGAMVPARESEVQSHPRPYKGVLGQHRLQTLSQKNKICTRQGNPVQMGRERGCSGCILRSVSTSPCNDKHVHTLMYPFHTHAQLISPRRRPSC